MNKNKFSIKQRLKSFLYAFAGLRTAIKTQHNLWIHITATITVIILGVFCEISKTEWMFITIVIGLVIFAELVNTAIEFLADTITHDYNESIKHAKDVAASAVLITAITAVITGCIIFIPKLF